MYFCRQYENMNMSEAKFIKYENLYGGPSILTDSGAVITPPIVSY